MLKISKVISTCNHCEFCIYTKSVADNHTHFAICTGAPVPQVLEKSNDNIANYDIEIPYYCPLEDYKEPEV
jgi:hypothetical protein